MAFTNPSVSDFQNYFFRDFPYGTDPNVAVLSQDIANAFVQTNISINQALWSDQSSYTLGYLLLSAHYMVLNIRASSQGLNGQWNWAQNSKAVGSVNEGFEIPERIKQNPEWMAYYKTNYGAMYMNLVLPLLTGQTFTVCGTTLP